MLPRTSSVRRGLLLSISATTPATGGAAIDVPFFSLYWLPGVVELILTHRATRTACCVTENAGKLKANVKADLQVYAKANVHGLRCRHS